MPQILSVSRLKGSAYRAKDFIVGEGREQFQNDLKETLARTLGNKRIVIHNALIRLAKMPMQILDPIQQANIAVEQNLTNKEKCHGPACPQRSWASCDASHTRVTTGW